MEREPQKPELAQRLSTQILIIAGAWTGIIAASLGWNIYSHEYIMATHAQFDKAVWGGHVVLWLLVLSAIVFFGRQWQKTFQHLIETTKKLDHQKQKQQALLDALPDLIFVFDSHGRYLKIAGNQSQLLLKPKEEMLGKTISEVLPKPLAPQRMALIHTVLETGTIQYFEYEIELQGEVRIFEGRIVPSVDDEVLFITRDITERRVAAETLRELKEFNETIIQRVAEGIVVQNLDGRFSFVNPAAAEMLGYTVEELTGASWKTIIPEDQQALVEAADERRAVGKSDHYELEMLRKNGTRITVLTSGNPMYRDGKFVGSMAVITDIDALKEAEAALENANDELEFAVLRANELAVAAEKANQAKSEFLATMSHEIRTPMNGIIGMTELALDTPLTTEQREYLNAVQNSAEALLGIINDILDFSKIEAGKFELEEINFDLHETVERLGDILSQRALQKNLELLIHVEPQAITTVRGDPLRLRQILVNLVGNAIKFTDEGEIRVEAVMLSAADDSVEFQISVADTGIGIPKDKQSLIFETFSQADSSTTRKYGGTGLGLTISKQLVAMMGGRLWVESEVGQGSVFNFTLNLPRQHQKQLPDENLDVLRGKRVLVVDDNATSRRMLVSTLEFWGCFPEEATSGSRAMRALEHALHSGTLPDVVLVDVHMPGTNGIELLQTIRHTKGLIELPVVMLPMVNTLREVTSRRDLNWTDYVTKPVKQSELLRGLLVAFGKLAPPVRETPQDISGSGVRKADVRILLAEDNEINRRLAIAMLEREGYRLDTAENGKVALDMMEATRYDLILMDVQMPEMDGVEATAAIRANPAWEHIPIIAMTAHALKGDREHFLSVGMDDYVTKPIRTKEVTAAIERQLARITPVVMAERDKPETGEVTALPANDILDPSGPMEWLDGDVHAFSELLSFFLSEAEGYLRDLNTAIAEGDENAVAQIAHKLKGSAANMGASQVQAASFELEKMGKAADLTNAQTALETLQSTFVQLQTYCREEIFSAVSE